LPSEPGCRPHPAAAHRSRGVSTNKRKGFTETGYAGLLDTVHQQLDGPIVLVWDNLNTHLSRAMADLIAARDWLTVFQLPPDAHELNPAELVWSHLKRSLANLAKHTISQLTPCEDPAQADAIPARLARGVPGQHPPGPHTLLQHPPLRIVSRSARRGARACVPGLIPSVVSGPNHWLV
jgi:DDE superfamily endonuclease